MRILLVMPTPYETGRLGLENVVWLSEPVALTSIAAMVCDKHQVKVLDMRLEHEDVLAETLRDFKPDLVGTTSMTTDVYQAKAVLRMARAIVPNALTVVGGHAPTLQPESFEAPYVDVIVQGEGEGEETFLEICERWSKSRKLADSTFQGVHGTRHRLQAEGYRSEPKRGQVTQLDTLPAPNRRLIDKYKGRYFFTAARPMASIFTSRGCSFDCNFCALIGTSKAQFEIGRGNRIPVLRTDRQTSLPCSCRPRHFSTRQEHYSTVRPDEQREAIAKVIDLAGVRRAKDGLDDDVPDAAGG